MRAKLKNKKKIVVKVGSSVLVDEEGKISASQFRALVKDLAVVVSSGVKVILVSSGAIAAGLSRLGISRRPHQIPKMQAIAAAGQTALMHEYEKAFGKHGLKCAQVLLTREDLSNRKRFLNARHTIQEIFKLGLVPIINENDTVAVHEIKVGDNDNLSSLVTGLAEADLLIGLSDVSGVYEEDPRLNPDADRIPTIRNITSRLKKGATGSHRVGSTGGMVTKLEAAEKAQRFGVATIIANGKEKNIIQRLLRGEDIGTLILPKNDSDRLSGKKHWIAYHLRSAGTLVVDRGAREVLLKKGKSLLPSGIKKVEGHFQQGDPVDLKVQGGKAFARGLVGYSSAELDKIQGCKSREIEGILGFKNFDEVIHRDDMVIL